MIDLDVKPSYFYNIDFEIIKEKFISYNKHYFKAIYFTFAQFYQSHFTNNINLTNISIKIYMIVMLAFTNMNQF